MIEVSRSVTIQRPLAEVQAQFADVAYHERNGHHRGVAFRVLEETDGSCEYEQQTRVGPIRVGQRFRLARDAPSHQVNELVAGAFSPGRITFDIVAAGPPAGDHSETASDSAIVTATLRSTRGGVTRFAAPLLRPVLGRALAKALDEDRADLESGAYARVEPGESDVAP